MKISQLRASAAASKPAANLPIGEHFRRQAVVRAKAGSMPATHSRYRKDPIMLFTEIVSALGLGILTVDVEETIDTYL